MTNEELKNVIMLELAAPENPSERLMSEEESKAVYERYKHCGNNVDWNYVFEPIKSEKLKETLVNVYKALDTKIQGF
jgi:hypothetical protein